MALPKSAKGQSIDQKNLGNNTISKITRLAKQQGYSSDSQFIEALIEQLD